LLRLSSPSPLFGHSLPPSEGERDGVRSALSFHDSQVFEKMAQEF
jgi:hypothetical protein